MHGGPSGLADLSLWSGPQQVSFHHQHHHHITPSLTEGEKVKRQANRQTLRPRALGLGLDCRVNPLTKRAVFNPGVLSPLCPSAVNLMGCTGCCRGTLSLLKRWILVEPVQCHWARHFLILEDGVMSESTSLDRSAVMRGQIMVKGVSY